MSTKIETLELEILSNSTSATSGLDALTSSLTALKNSTKGKFGLSNVAVEVRDLNKALKESSNINNKTAASFTDLFYKSKLGAGGIKKVINAIEAAITKSNDYTENVNLFTVSMGAYANKAMEYAEIVSDAMGIDTSEWIRNQGIFMTLATGFGVASDRAAVMSKNLTQLSYDLASFYNMEDVETAFLKLKSGLAGELEPLRAIGYDLSQARLEATAVELGINKTLSSMTQAEKAQLRYYAIMTQVTETHGDMARTLDAPANQLRVFKAEINMAAREIGNVFIPALNAILPYAIAVTKVVGTLASTIAGLFGAKKDGLSEITDNAAENTNTMTQNLEQSQEEAKKLKSYLLGFDELNVINPNTDETSSGEFDFPLPDYSDTFLSGLVESKVAEIVEDMKEWLGITDDIDTWSEALESRLGRILTTVGLIGVGLAAWKFSTTFMDNLDALKLVLSSPATAIPISIILTITGFKIAIGGMESAIEDGLDGFNFAEIIGGALFGTGSVALLGKLIATYIDKAFSKSKIALKLTEGGINLGVGTIGATGAAIAAAVSGIILGIPTYFIGIYDACVAGIDWLNGLLISAGATAAGAGIGTIIGMLGGPIGAGIGALIGLAVGLVTDLVILIVQNWDAISAWFVGIPIWFDTNVIQPIAECFSNLWSGITAIWSVVAPWFDTNVVQPLVNVFAPIVEGISTFFEGCWIIIQAVWIVASTWVYESWIKPVVANFKWCGEQIAACFTWAWDAITTEWKASMSWWTEEVIQPVAANFNWCKEQISASFTFAWDYVTEKWGKFSTWVTDNITTPVKKVFDEACKYIGDVFSSMWAGIQVKAVNAMNGLIEIIEGCINKVIGGINGLMDGFNDIVEWAADIVGTNWKGITVLKEVSLPRISVPQYAEGGFPERGQMFIAREAGAEMVGNIGRRTAVANNDQIVAGIAGGVASANEEQNALLREQNSLLRAILEKDSGVYLDGKNLANSVEKYQRERGRVLITGGVI